MYVKKIAVLPMVTAILAVFSVSQAQAQLCANKAGQVFSRAQCKAKETIVPGTPGPIGPVGPQGPAGAGITNGPCIQADVANGAWTMNFFDTLSNESDFCFVSFDVNANLRSGSYCLETIGQTTVQVPIIQGNLTLGAAEACGYVIDITKQNNMRWSGLVTMDRTRSVVQGFAGIVNSATTVRTNAAASGVRWGATGSPATAQVSEHQQIDKSIPYEAAKNYMRLMSEERN